jgi:predicted transcriptional regulator
MASSTSSIRIPDELKTQLETTARRMKKPKNWIITRALQEYLDRHNREAFLAEARRQSLLASKKKWEDEEYWDKLAAEVLRDE